MQRKIATTALIFSCGLSSQVFAGAFEIKTSEGTLPKKETKRPLSLPKDLLKIDLDTSYTHWLAGFNSLGLNNCDPLVTSSCSTQTPSFMIDVPGGDPAAGSEAHTVLDKQLIKLNVDYG